MLKKRLRSRCLLLPFVCLIVLAAGAGPARAGDSVKQVAEKFIQYIWNGDYQQMYGLFSASAKEKSGTAEAFVSAMNRELGSGGLSKFDEFMLQKDESFQSAQGTPAHRVVTTLMTIFMGKVKLEVGRITENGETAEAEIVIAAPNPDNLPEEENKALQSKMNELIVKATNNELSDADIKNELEALIARFPIVRESENLKMIKENGKWVIDDSAMINDLHKNLF